jgi:hypothetical protein
MKSTIMLQFIFSAALILCTYLLTAQSALIMPEKIERIFPKWVGNGDREFDGHGPKITGNVRLSISEGKGQLIAHINFTLEETEGDKTKAVVNETRLVYNAPAGKQIKQIINPTTLQSDFDYVQQGHGPRRKNAAAGGPVSHISIQGDTGGYDVGNNTNDDSYVSVYFKGLVIELEPLPAGVSEIRISKTIIATALKDKLKGTTGRLNTYGTRNGDTWYKKDDSWIKFPEEVRSDKMMIDGLIEVKYEGWRYYYNDINLSGISAKADGKYIQVYLSWEGDGPEARGECVNHTLCALGSPSLQLNDFQIFISLRPVVQGGKLGYDKGDIQVNFKYAYGADCGLASFLCNEVFKDIIASSFFNAKFLLASGLRPNETSGQISDALNNGVLDYIKLTPIGRSASAIVDVTDDGNNLRVRFR